MIGAFFTGLAGPQLLDSERAFLSQSRPAGIILFARNMRGSRIRSAASIADAAKRSASDDVPRPDRPGRRPRPAPAPAAWRAPAAGAQPIAALYAGDRRRGAREARASAARLIAADLRALGINTNCAPVLDVPVAGSHEIIGDRAFGDDPADVIALGRAVAAGHLAGGVVPVIKHIPGHGRARADSHLELPVVETPRATLEATDFAPFKALADCPAAMTAHVVYTAIDPALPASTSPIVHRDVIRGHIGFDGLLMSDDLSMKALGGPMRDRASAVIAAGSDIALHCNGDLAEMEAVAAAAGAQPLRRLCALPACVAVTHQQTPSPSMSRPPRLALAGVLALSA